MASLTRWSTFAGQSVRILTMPLVARSLARQCKKRNLDPAKVRAKAKKYWMQDPARGEEGFGAGAAAMEQFAAGTVALYRAFVDQGLSHEGAVTATAAVNWEVYARISAPWWKLSRLMGRDPLSRVQTTMTMLMGYPYAWPGYDMRTVHADANIFAFHVRKCPPAAFFEARGLSDLCTEAFCNLDYPLADAWGVRMERPTTLALGGDFCDFRFLRK